MKNAFRIALLLLAVVAASIGWKTLGLGYAPTMRAAKPGYRVELRCRFSVRHRDVSVSALLPASDARQEITDTAQKSPLHFEQRDGVGQWTGTGIDGDVETRYGFFVRRAPVQVVLPAHATVQDSYADTFDPYLAATDLIQCGDPAIVARSRQLFAGRDVVGGVTAAYNYVLKDVIYRDIRGRTDAVTCLKLGEASCNGKNRLLVALLRARGVPARLVKGFIMTAGYKRTTHAWSEAYIGTEWVPMCPVNGHFAELPGHYLQIAVGDRPLFRHTRDIDFDWVFRTRQVQSGEAEVLLANMRSPHNVLRAWEELRNSRISLAFLVTMLMIPFGALVVVAARNVVGVLPFGTFMPMLIAVAFRETGFGWGLLLLSLIMLAGGCVREVLNRIQTLHIPRLAVVLTLSVILILAFAMLAVKLGKPQLAGVGMFPLAIMTLTTERFTDMVDREGYAPALRRLLVTYIVSAVCYVVMRQFWLRALVVAFPELLVAVIAANIFIGGWDGLRLLEYIRFRRLLTVAPDGEAAE